MGASVMFWVVFGALASLAITLVLVDEWTEAKRRQDAAVADLETKYPRRLRVVRDDETAL